MFTGNPESVLFKTKEGDEDGQPPADDGAGAKMEVDSLADSEDLEEERIFVHRYKNIGNKRVPPEQFKEIDRLAYVVRAIEHDCSVIPCGAFKLTPTHELRYDENFEGLNAGELENTTSWQHFRPPQDEEMKKRISKLFVG
jgi:radial spoke head protein 9